MANDRFDPLVNSCLPVEGHVGKRGQGAPMDMEDPLNVKRGWTPLQRLVATAVSHMDAILSWATWGPPKPPIWGSPRAQGPLKVSPFTPIFGASDVAAFRRQHLPLGGATYSDV